MPKEPNVSGTPGPVDPPAAGDPQQTPTGPPDGGKDPQALDTVSRAELEKVIGERQAAKERSRTVEQQLAELQKNTKLGIDDEQYKVFQEWQTNRSQADKDKAIKTGDVQAIEDGVRKPLQEKLTAKDQRIVRLEGQLTSLLKNQALMVAATAANAVNPDQVVGLLQHRVRIVADAATGQFQPEFLGLDGESRMYDGNGNPVTTAETFVKMYLGLPDNSNLVKAATAAGSGAKPTGGAADSRISPQTLEAYNALPVEERERIAKGMTPEQMKEFLGIPQPGKGGFL